MQKSHLLYLQYFTPPQSRTHTAQSLTNQPDKTSWWGCGAHVQMVLDNIPAEEHCTCEPKFDVGGKQYPPMAKSPN